MVDLLESLTKSVEQAAKEKKRGAHLSEDMCKTLIHIVDTVMNQNSVNEDQKRRCLEAKEILSS